MSIHNSQFSVTGTFNNANGDQVNYNHTTITHIHGDDEKVTECKIFSQFENVKRGYVIGMKELGSVDLSEWDWHWQNGELVWRRPKSARKTISTIQVHPDQQSKFTAIAYEGEDAQEAWEKDFKQFSRASRTGLFKLFGINRSEIPMLIFHHELIPVAHFYTKSLWMGLYMEYLRRNKRCKDEYLWMDTRRGILCSGPAGPRVIFPGLPNKDESALRALPSTLNMLEEGTCVAFFSKFGSNVDVGVLNCAWRFHERTYLDDLFPKMMEDYQHKGNNHSQLMTNYPYLEHLWRNPLHHLTIDIIGGLRFDTIYSPLLEPIARWPPEAPGPWRWSDVCGLMEKTRADETARPDQLPPIQDTTPAPVIQFILSGLPNTSTPLEFRRQLVTVWSLVDIISLMRCLSFNAHVLGNAHQDSLDAQHDLILGRAMRVKNSTAFQSIRNARHGDMRSSIMLDRNAGVNEGCEDEDLWMDTRRGILCSGPTGPHVTFPVLPKDGLVLQGLPSTLDMLEEGTSVAFFSKFGSNMDSSVLACAWRFCERTYLDDLFPKMTEAHQHKDNNHPQLMADYPYLECLWQNPPHHLPIDIISGLCFGTVYSPLLEPVVRWPPEAPGLWKWNVNGLVEETQVDGGLTRFKLVGQEGEVCLYASFSYQTFWEGWLSQSSHVFDFLKTTGHQESFCRCLISQACEEGSLSFVLLAVIHPPWIMLHSIQHEYEAYDGLLAFFDLCDVEETQPIYLFFYPLPMSISELISWMDGHTHFWSFDENGQSRIPEKEWKQWDIPVFTPCSGNDTILRSWPTHIYTALCNWQIARGFNSSTADWAQELGIPKFEIVGEMNNNQLKEIPEQPEKSGWNWLWSAFAGSDISACAC
ncbi:hypothetical protein WG66_011233 [Moniliophthora roreri]|nr:hypothetical protein WG66_011233 [Moniliophthora roreri]